MMLTPSGRFDVNTKICISFTNYHEELWQPAWGVRTAIIGLQGFFPLKGTAAVGVGSLEAPASERRRLAKLSREWVCPHCNLSNVESLPDAPTPSESSSATSGNREAEAESAEGDQKALLSANATAVSSQASSPDTRVGQSLHSADTQQTPTGSSAASVSLSSQREQQQQAFSSPSGSSETHVQQTEEKDRSGQRGASAYDESSSTDDDSSPLEVGTSEVDEPSGTSTSSPHSLSTSVSQARPQNLENETGVRQRASGNAYAQAGRSASSPAAGQDDHHLFRSSVARSSSSPSRRSLMVLDGAIVMLLVWVGALVTRKLL